MADAAPEARVVIPARNASTTLLAVLEGLDAQSLDRSSFEVVVVDNGSTDDTALIAAERGAGLVRVPEPNRSTARNAGAAGASGGRLAFLDADCVPAAPWLEGLLKGLEGAALAAGPIVPTTGEPPNRIERFELAWRFRQRSYVQDSGWAPSGNLAIRTSDFRSLGGFDPGFRRGGEDVDLCLRAGAAGQDIAWCETAVVSHPAERSLSGLLHRGARHGFAAAHHARATAGAYGRLYWRHPGPLARGDWALRRFGVDPGELAPSERRSLMRLARAEYAARMIGSIAAEAAGVRRDR